MVGAHWAVWLLLAAAPPRVPSGSRVRPAPDPAPVSAAARSDGSASDPARGAGRPKAAPPRVSPADRPAPVPEPAPVSTTARPDLTAADPARAVRPKTALRLALPDVTTSGELPPRQVALLETALLAELRKLEGVSVIGMSEIRQMLSFEYQRQMMGCQADGQCLAEIAGALGVDEMLHVSVIVEPRISTFTLRRISMRQASVVGAHAKRLDRAGGEELLGAVGPAVQQAFPDRALRPGVTRGVDKSIALRLNPPPLPRWVFFGTAGAAVLAGAGGAVAGLMSADAQRQWRSLSDRASTQPVPGSELAALERTARSRARTANVLFVAGGALAVAAGVEAFFTDWHGYRAQLEVGGGAAAVRVAGRF